MHYTHMHRNVMQCKDIKTAADMDYGLLFSSYFYFLYFVMEVKYFYNEEKILLMAILFIHQTLLQVLLKQKLSSSGSI